MLKKIILLTMFSCLILSSVYAKIPYDHSVASNVTVDFGIDAGLSLADRLAATEEKGDVLIVTYSLPKLKNAMGLLKERNITLVCHEQFISRARWIKNNYKNTTVYTMPELHAKVVLIAPDTVWIGSPNFGSSGWTESAVGMKDKRIYDYYYKRIMSMIKTKCNEIK